MPYKNIKDAKSYARAYQKKHGHEYYIKNKEKLLAQIKSYRHKNKDKIVNYQQKWREKNREYLRQKASNLYYNNHEKYLTARTKCFLKLKLEVLNVYSNNNPKCACCGEKEIEFLQLDHVGGGGNKHRKQIKRTGTSYYFWLRKNNYPKGYQILCANCNHAIGRLGICPHKK